MLKKIFLSILEDFFEAFLPGDTDGAFPVFIRIITIIFLIAVIISLCVFYIHNPIEIGFWSVLGRIMLIFGIIASGIGLLISWCD